MDRSTVCRLSHSATVTLGARSTSRTCLSGCADRRVFDLNVRETASLANLVEEEGIEPSFAGCRPAVLPLNDSPMKLVAYHATALPLSYIGLEPEGVIETPASALRMRRSST